MTRVLQWSITEFSWRVLHFAGTLRFIGNVDFAEGNWLGVELRTPRGKNDGSVQGQRYFNCRPNHGLLVRPSKVTVRGINGAKLLGDLNASKD